MSERLTPETGNDIVADPIALLSKYESDVYPPTLSKDERKLLKAYLGGLGLEPRIGVISMQENPTIANLMEIAMSGLHLPQGMSRDDIIVGPHTLDEHYALSLWMPKPKKM